MISIYEIAKQAGVSTATVSRVLNPQECHKVRSVTRAKVMAICNQAHYRPCAVARGLARGETANIALILGDSVGDLSSPIFSEFISGLAEGLQFRGYNMTLHTVDRTCEGHEERLSDFLFSDYADGYILGNSLITVPMAELVCSLGHPVVSLVHHTEKLHQVSSVITDDSGALCALLKGIPSEYCGHSLFLGIGGREEVNARFKYGQIRSSLETLGLSPDFFQMELFPVADPGFYSRRINGQEYCETHLDSLKKFPLIWCESDMLALGLCDAFRRKGIVPGRDIRLIGFDNIERIFGAEHPLLTTIDYHAREQGIETAEFMVSRIVNHEMPERDFFTESEPIVRESCNWT